MVGYVDKENSNERYYFIKDHLGSIRQVINENGNISSARDYYPYGSILRETNNGQEERFKFTALSRRSVFTQTEKRTRQKNGGQA